MHVEEVVGQRIAAARERSHMTQADLGRALAPLLGRPWSRQAVSAAEKGGRDFKIAELIVIARVLKTTVSQLVLPGPEITGGREERQAIVFPSGQAITAMDLINAVLSPEVDLDSERGHVLRTGNELAERIVDFRVKSIEAGEAGQRAMDALTSLLQQIQNFTRVAQPQGEEST